MAAVQQLRVSSALTTLVSRVSALTTTNSPRPIILLSRSNLASLLSLPRLAIAVPAALQTIPGILGDIWEGILKAVPKSKTSHMKRRHRQMAGKALKDVNNLNKCPACGQTKKMHTLCTHCMGKIQDMFPNTSAEAK